jgi:DNA (cytosine-5)-methyltransferase 1
LTVREAARLQSFPDDYRFLGGLIDQYTVVGNAVPPKFSEYIGKVLIDLYERFRKDGSV